MKGSANHSKLILFRCLALSFFAIFVLIVLVANRGEGNRWWGFLVRHEYGDKIGHLGLVGTLCFLGNLALTLRHIPRLPRFITTVTFILLSLLTIEELSQAFIPTRTCDLFDWLADLCGLALGQTAALFVRARLLR
ncbi:MAG: trypsin [Verrucomicrobiales bacterium VVV1]|nr:MAG: trypsin [Verrucomicrobiales bacterium VVV1]